MHFYLKHGEKLWAKSLLFCDQYNLLHTKFASSSIATWKINKEQERSRNQRRKLGVENSRAVRQLDIVHSGADTVFS